MKILCSGCLQWYAVIALNNWIKDKPTARMTHKSYEVEGLKNPPRRRYTRRSCCCQGNPRFRYVYSGTIFRCVCCTSAPCIFPDLKYVLTALIAAVSQSRTVEAVGRGWRWVPFRAITRLFWGGSRFRFSSDKLHIEDSLPPCRVSCTGVCDNYIRTFTINRLLSMYLPTCSSKWLSLLKSDLWIVLGNWQQRRYNFHFCFSKVQGTVEQVCFFIIILFGILMLLPIRRIVKLIVQRGELRIVLLACVVYLVC